MRESDGMNYSIGNIKHDVRVIIGENENILPFLSVEAGDPEDASNVANERDILIESHILTAIDNVHSVAPREMLHDIVEVIHQHADFDTFGGFSKIDLPNDFMRFIKMTDDGWDIPVAETTAIESDAYKQLHSRFEGIRASKERPAVAIYNDGYKLRAEAYPTLTNPTLQYISKARIDNEGNVRIASLCYKAVLYLIASHYYISIKESDAAGMMEKQCRALLGLSDN